MRYESPNSRSSTSVSVQRVYRNGKVVSVGQTLLVQGDIILLNPGDQAPTQCISVSSLLISILRLASLLFVPFSFNVLPQFELI